MDNTIQNIIERYLENQATEGQIERLHEWVESSSANRDEFSEQLRKHYREQVDAPQTRQAAQYMARTLTQRLRRRRIMLRWSVAAAVAVVLTCGVVGVSRFADKPSSSIAQNQMPTVTLENGETIRLDTVAASISEIRQSAHQKQNPDSLKKNRYQTLDIPKGYTFRLTLADGTQVILNAGSQLKFPAEFSGQERRVQLVGEGCFSVKHDPAHPFYVETPQMTLKVLGTQFNIRCYSDEARLTTTLVQGSIAQQFADDTRWYHLSPDQQSVYEVTTKAISLRDVDAAEALAWVDGHVLLRDRPLSEILSTLTHWYGVEIRYDDVEIANEKYYLHAELSAGLETILNNLSLSGEFRFEFKNNTVYVHKK